MTINPKVTIILTSYNHANFIREAINSAINQTFKNFELIIWDDASTDESWNIINSYSDSRIKKFKNEINQGGVIYKALNSNLIFGEYIAIHHSDDVWELDKLEKQVKILDSKPDLGAVFTWVQVIDEFGNYIKSNWFNQHNKSEFEHLNDLFFIRNRLAHPSVLIRKSCYEILGNYKFPLAQCPDAEMWSRLLLLYKIFIIPEKLTFHRIFSDYSNTSSKTFKNQNRLFFEWNFLRKNYLNISDMKTFISIFPSMRQFENYQVFNVKFLLAKICIEECEDLSAKMLGLTWLLELMLTDDSRLELKNNYQFDLKDLTSIFNKIIFFGDENVKNKEIIALNKEIIALNKEIAALNKEIAALKENKSAVLLELQSVYNSNSWKITKPLRWAFKMFNFSSFNNKR
jgi:glycosyltransferase involved in cell wall biosynthesis